MDAVATLLGVLAACSPSGIEVVAVGRVPGTATDKLAVAPQVLEDGTPHNRLGGFGSAIAYTGVRGRYVAVPDRGPGAATSYVARYHLIDIEIRPDAALRFRLVATVPLSDGSGHPLVGSSSAFDVSDPSLSWRIDSEAIRVSSRGTLFISDEYGPFVDEFDAQGRRLRRFSIPEKFRVTHLSPKAREELPPYNTRGRQAKAGMEGLAISPNGERIYALMQSPLLQDHALDRKDRPVGRFTRLLEIELSSGKTREFVYELESSGHGTNEILAINDHEFLVIERDWEPDTAKAFKQIFKIDIRGASDVSALESLPVSTLPKGVRAVGKQRFVDLRSRSLGLKLPACPEKAEGLAFGPELANGHRLLLVSCDNDFNADVDSTIVALSIAPALLPEMESQVLRPDVIVLPAEAGEVSRRTFAILGSPLFDASAIDVSTVVVRCVDAEALPQAAVCVAGKVNQDEAFDLSCKVTFDCVRSSDGHGDVVVEARTSTGSRVYGQIVGRELVPAAPKK